MGNSRSPHRRHQRRIFAIALGSALTVAAFAIPTTAIVDFSVSNGQGQSITGAGGRRVMTANGLEFTITPKPGVGVKFTDTPGGLTAVAKGEVTGRMVPGAGKASAPQMDLVTSPKAITVTKSAESGSSTVIGDSGVVKWTKVGYDVDVKGNVVMTSEDKKLARSFRATGGRATVRFEDDKSRKTPAGGNGLDSVIDATLTERVKIDVQLAANPGLNQEKGSYVATGDKLVLGPRGTQRTLTLTGNITISGAGAQTGTVSGATKLILTLNSKNEIVGEEIIGDETAGVPLTTIIPLPPPGKATGKGAGGGAA